MAASGVRRQNKVKKSAIKTKRACGTGRTQSLFNSFLNSNLVMRVSVGGEGQQRKSGGQGK